LAFPLLSYPTKPPAGNIPGIGVNVGLSVGLSGRLRFAVLPVAIPSVLTLL
jgi:hypothetical protein